MKSQRLTQKVNNKYYIAGSQIDKHTVEEMFNNIVSKLGKIEDIEDKYGTDFETLVKELSNGGVQ